MDSEKDKIFIDKYKSTHDIELVGRLYQPYMPLVYGVCLKYLKDRNQSQDAVMDIFEKLTTDLLKYETPINFRTWLYVVAKNFCLMKLRHDGSENKAFKKMSSDFVENGFATHPLDEPDETYLSPALKKCMEQLKEVQRRSIELFYYQKLCYKEIAENLNISEKKVKSDIQNGKRNLKLCIENVKESSIKI